MKSILTLILVLFVQNAFAYNEADDNYENYDDYDSIVGSLSNTSSARYNDKIIDLDNMKLHAGFGFNNTVMDLKPTSTGPDKVTLQGFQLSLGIDLFSPNVITEVGLINYNSTTKEQHRYGMKEFDLKTYYRHHLNRIIALRGGIGMGVRYIDIAAQTGSLKYTNPVSQILLGGEAKLGKQLSFVTEFSYKNSMTGNSPEKSALDLTFRVDGHF